MLLFRFKCAAKCVPFVFAIADLIRYLDVVGVAEVVCAVIDTVGDIAVYAG